MHTILSLPHPHILPFTHHKHLSHSLPCSYDLYAWPCWRVHGLFGYFASQAYKRMRPFINGPPSSAASKQSEVSRLFLDAFGQFLAMLAMSEFMLLTYQNLKIENVLSLGQAPERHVVIFRIFNWFWYHVKWSTPGYAWAVIQHGEMAYILKLLLLLREEIPLIGHSLQLLLENVLFP